MWGAVVGPRLGLMGGASGLALHRVGRQTHQGSLKDSVTQASVVQRDGAKEDTGAKKGYKVDGWCYVGN